MRDHRASEPPFTIPRVFPSSVMRAPEEVTDSQGTKYLASPKCSRIVSTVSTACARVVFPYPPGPKMAILAGREPMLVVIMWTICASSVSRPKKIWGFLGPCPRVVDIVASGWVIELSSRFSTIWSKRASKVSLAWKVWSTIDNLAS
ncbi:hypothetical protein EI94DRAFT_1726625 [Lactarius quietus]|nr:hypothetical protein EI94DRAFT_1726625 [Lactarius quietus]